MSENDTGWCGADRACGTNERTEHACGSHVAVVSVPSIALQYRGRVCFVISVQPAADVYELVTFQMPGTSGKAGLTVVELRSPFWRK